jgi:hypothetical protein
MRVIAARFAEARAATRLEADLRARFELGPGDIGVAPLGGADDAPDAHLVVAGRFHDARVGEVLRLIQQAGGTVVADVDEVWTKPRPSRETPTSTWIRPGWRGEARESYG